MSGMANYHSSHRQRRNGREDSSSDDNNRRHKKRSDERKGRFDNNKGEVKNDDFDSFANNDRSSDAIEGNDCKNIGFGYGNSSFGSRGRGFHGQRGGRGSSFRRDNVRGGQRFFGGGGRYAGHDGGNRRGGFSSRGAREDRFCDFGGGRFGNRQRDFDDRPQQHCGFGNREDSRRRDESPKPVMKLIDPAAVPRSGRYFEHDSRDAPFSGRDRDARDRRHKRMYDPRADYSSQRRDVNRKRSAPTGWRNQPFGLDDSKKSRNAGYKDEDYRTGGRPCSDVDGVWTHDKFEEVMREENTEQ